MKDLFGFDSVGYDNNSKCLVIIDQTLLPGREEFLSIDNEEILEEAIKSLKVRGAPAIGIAAAIGIAVLMDRFVCSEARNFVLEFERVSARIGNARPTAVNLKNAMERLSVALHSVAGQRTDIESLKKAILTEALLIKEEDIKSNMIMADHALTLLNNNPVILTYCNAGHLAVSRYGTALSPVYLAKERGFKVKVFACETRPLLQGARLTAYELDKAGVDVTLVCDNTAAHLLSSGMIDAVITGCDRIAANGDVANKIGTHTLSVCASHYGVPHYVIGPASTIDPACSNGSEIVIEQRDSIEVTEMWYKKRMAPDNIKVFNPAFDITPSSLITAIITEQGIFRYPYRFEKND